MQTPESSTIKMRNHNLASLYHHTALCRDGYGWPARFPFVGIPKSKMVRMHPARVVMFIATIICVYLAVSYVVIPKVNGGARGERVKHGKGKGKGTKHHNAQHNKRGMHHHAAVRGIGPCCCC